MSGGPPHHPRQVAPAWNHLQVPNYYPPRQPQHAHMSNEHSVLHQPTWHTPTTEPLKPHSHIFSLEQMLSDRQFPRHTPGVDLSLTRNGGQNGELPPAPSTPISLSVRDTNKINSLSALDIQPLDINPGLKVISPGTKLSPVGSDKVKRGSKRVDSILERLKNNEGVDGKDESRGVIVQAGSHDENSSSSSILNVPRDDEVVSPCSNEDSLDSNKSRRKRKPSKTIRVAQEDKIDVPQKETEILQVAPSLPSSSGETIEEKKIPERRRSCEDHVIHHHNTSPKTRRKTSSESETIDDIAAMVQEGLDDNNKSKAVSVSVIKTIDNLESVTTSQPTKNTQLLVDVENKLEEMFAGIEEDKTAEEVEKTTSSSPVIVTSPSSNPAVTSTCSDLKQKKSKRRRVRAGKRGGDSSGDLSPKKRVCKKAAPTAKAWSVKAKNKKVESSLLTKDVYTYDSGSNSSRSRGPFIQIRGLRDSPLSVNVVNTPTNEEESDLKKSKSKKYHDDSEYRHKVRSRGLHCSTLSHRYDAQTKDASWICAFCKRGPHVGFPNESGPLGDLFGPYFITTNCPEFERRLDDPYDKQFKSKKMARSLDSSKFLSSSSGGKKKRVEEGGVVELGNGTFEVWAHEDCIVWSSGTYLIGPKIVGLEEAVWTSFSVRCDFCQLKGANICCVSRGCVRVGHVGCAKAGGWWFDEASYKAYCPGHRG